MIQQSERLIGLLCTPLKGISLVSVNSCVCVVTLSWLGVKKNDYGPLHQSNQLLSEQSSGFNDQKLYTLINKIDYLISTDRSVRTVERYVGSCLVCLLLFVNSLFFKSLYFVLLYTWYILFYPDNCFIIIVCILPLSGLVCKLVFCNILTFVTLSFVIHW